MADDDLESIFNDTLSEAGGEFGDSDDDFGTNADINMGDDDSDADLLDDGEDDNEVDDDFDDSEDTDGATDDESQGFDWATVKDQQVTVKVDGEEFAVTLEELRNGYMRQEAFTRRTQEVAQLRQAAEWAQQFQEAIQSDPEGTIQFLAERFGIQTQPEIDPFENIDPEVAPLVQAVRQQEQMLNQMRAEMAREREAIANERALAEVKAEVAALRGEFPDIDDVSLRNTLEIAAQRGLPLRDAHILANADKVLKSNTIKAKAEADAKKVADKEARELAKRQKAKQTLPGRSARGKAVDSDPDFDDFGEMLSWNLSQAR